MSELNNSNGNSGVPKGNPANLGVDYATAILTTKSPQQAALILPNALNASTKLINSDLTKWFSEYSNAIRSHNSNLKRLVDQGARIFTQEQFQGEYSNFPRYWNLTLDSIHNEIKHLENVDRTVKRQILTPLMDAVDKDVRLSELMINSQELSELSSRMARGLTSQTELDWNYKAPASFASLESYKSYEIQLTFDVIFNFLSAHHDRLTQDLQINEGSTKYLLNNYKLDDELNFYLDHLQKTEFAPTEGDLFLNDQVKQQQKQLSSSGSSTKPKRLSAFPKTDNHSIISSNSGSTQKKSSSLKSKVGSIFGRKKKAPKHTSNFSNDAIAESGPLSTTSSSQQLPLAQPIYPPQQNASRDHSLRAKSSGAHTHAPPIQQSVPQKEAPRSVSTPSQQAFPVPQYYTKPSPFGDSPELPATPSNPTYPVNKVSPPVGSSFLPPLTPTVGSLSSTKPLVAESPNVVKYQESDSDSTSDDEDVPQDLEKRSNGLQTTEQNSHFGSSQGRTLNPSLNKELPGSFPTEAPSTARSDTFNSVDYDGTSNSSVSARQLPDAIAERNALPDPKVSPQQPQHVAAAPIPPPSRKVVHHSEPTQTRNRKEVHSQLFHNLPAARDSVIQPFSGPGFVAQQDTGTASLRQNDYFKHFNGTTGEQQGLNSSISEVINANFKDGKLTKSQIIGEVAFSYNPTSYDISEQQEPILLRIPDKFDKVILNNSFVEKVGTDNYKINSSLITSKTLGALKYSISLEDQEVPVFIQHVWKHEEHQSSLIINLKLNTSQYDTVPLVLQSLVVSAALKRDVVTTSASLKPVGSFNIESNRVTWRYTQPLILGGGHPTEEKIIARFVTNSIGSEHEGGVQLKFQIEEPTIHRATIYNLNNDSKEIPAVRHLASGNYSGHS